MVLALGMGLTATIPAGASIIHVPGTHVITNGSPFNLTLNGLDRLQINVSSGSASFAGNTIGYQASGISNLISDNNSVNVPLGHYETIATLPILGNINAPVMDNLDAGTTIGIGSLTSLPPYTIPLINITANISGFAGNISIKPFFGNTTIYGPYGEFVNTWGYAGFQFQDTDGIHYGWVHGIANYNTSTNTIINVTIDGYAYETVACRSILAGAVPIPGSILLLGSGLFGLGLLGWRRKKS